MATSASTSPNHPTIEVRQTTACRRRDSFSSLVYTFKRTIPKKWDTLPQKPKSGQPVAIELAPGRCFFTLACKHGLAAGDTLVVTIGDRRAGGPRIEVAHHPTYGDWQLVCDLDREGDGNFVRQDLMPHIRVITAPPSHVLARTKSSTQPGVPADLQITVTDRFGNHVENFRGTFRPTENGANHTTRTEFSLEPKDIGSKHWQNSIVFREEGTHRVKVESVGLPGDAPLRGVSHPVVCDSRADDYQLLWGDIHGHSYCSDGTHSPEHYYGYGREVGYLDFCALTDHDTFSEEVWKELMESAESANQPGRFTTFLGYEWSGEWEQSICVLFKERRWWILSGQSESQPPSTRPDWSD